jgi:hypothetical protein
MIITPCDATSTIDTSSPKDGSRSAAQVFSLFDVAPQDFKSSDFAEIFDFGFFFVEEF